MAGLELLPEELCSILPVRLFAVVDEVDDAGVLTVFWPEGVTLVEGLLPPTVALLAVIGGTVAPAAGGLVRTVD
jgi:hypothetical protein